MDPQADEDWENLATHEHVSGFFLTCHFAGLDHAGHRPLLKLSSSKGHLRLFFFFILPVSLGILFQTLS